MNNSPKPLSSSVPPLLGPGGAAADLIGKRAVVDFWKHRLTFALSPRLTSNAMFQPLPKSSAIPRPREAQ